MRCFVPILLICAALLALNAELGLPQTGRNRHEEGPEAIVRAP